MTTKRKSYDPGIYVITNTVNGKFYIGSSLDITVRFRNHKSDLRLNKHGNSHLQAAYNKYGADAFEYHILELCNELELLECEQSYLDRYWDYGVMYNINPVARSSAGRPPNPDAIAKRKATLKANPHKHSLATRERMSSAKKGVKLSPEHCAKLSATATGRKMSAESIEKGNITRAKTRASRPPRVFTEEEWAIIREKHNATRARNKAAKIKELENGSNV